MKRLLLLPLLVGACHKDPGPSCEKITDHMLDITKQAMPGHDPTLLGDRKAMIETCEKRKPTREVRNCLIAAKSMADLATCQPGGKPPERTPTPPPAATTNPPPAPTPAPPPAPSGSGG